MNDLCELKQKDANILCTKRPIRLTEATHIHLKRERQLVLCAGNELYHCMIKLDWKLNS